MQPVKKQEFDFTADGNQALLQEWKDAIGAIPFPKEDYSIDELLLDDEEKAEVFMTATYRFLEVNDDTWFWLSLLLYKNGDSSLQFQGSWTTTQSHRLLPVVNRSLKNFGLTTATELNALPGKFFNTWQQGYDYLCNIARNAKLPEQPVKLNS